MKFARPLVLAGLAALGACHDDPEVVTVVINITSQGFAVNGEGGRVGPELNVPQSIVEYRPEAQIRAFVRDPQRFRYTQMPANPHLSDADLDALLAYFHHMRAHKHDPLEAR